MKSRAGFTMVELLVVVLIIGVAAGATTIAWEAIVPRAKLNSAVRELASTLWTCRSDAIARNADFQIHYQIDENRYWVLSPYRVDGGLAETLEERQVIREVNLAPDVEIVTVTINETIHDQGVVPVFFDPRGTATGHTVLLRQAQFDRLFTLEVLSLTGLIRFHDGEYYRELPREGDFD